MRNFVNNFDENLKKCNNMHEILNCVNDFYKLDKPFGIATKLLVITGVKKIIKLIDAVEK